MNNTGARTTAIVIVLLLLLGCVIGGATVAYDFGATYFQHSMVADRIEKFEYTNGAITTQSGAVGGAIAFGLFASASLYGFVKVFLAWVK
jgi:hypothetical protein